MRKIVENSLLCFYRNPNIMNLRLLLLFLFTFPMQQSVNAGSSLNAYNGTLKNKVNEVLDLMLNDETVLVKDSRYEEILEYLAGGFRNTISLIAESIKPLVKKFIEDKGIIEKSASDIMEEACNDKKFTTSIHRINDLLSIDGQIC